MSKNKCSCKDKIAFNCSNNKLKVNCSICNPQAYYTIHEKEIAKNMLWENPEVHTTAIMQLQKVVNDILNEMNKPKLF